MYEDAKEKFGEYYEKNRKKIEDLLQYLRENYDEIVLWGAGLKGKAFLACCDNRHQYIDYVIDSDEKKQGQKMLTGHNIYGSDSLHEGAIVLIANVKYYQSICFTLANSGYDIKKLRIFSVDQYVEGKISLEKIKNNTIWEWKRYYD